MNPLTFIKSTYAVAIFSLALGLHGWAVEAQEDNAQAPTATEPTTQPSYLGVVTTDIPAVLTTHMGIAKGEGVIIRSVMPEGPASKAGLNIHDIITHIDGAATPSPLELSKLVKEYKPGSTIKLRLIKNGEISEADATLATRPDRFRQFDAGQLDQLRLEGVPPELADRMRGMIQGNIQRMDMPRGKVIPLNGDNDLNEAMKELQERLQERMEAGPQPEAKVAPNIKQATTLRMIDKQGSTELQSKNGKQEITVRDLDNDIIWSGPWNTDKDKAAAPDEIRERLDKLDFMNNQPSMLKLHIR